MKKKIIKAQLLTQKAFSLFGNVIEADDCSFVGRYNRDTADIFSDVACIDVNAKNGRVGMDIFRCSPLPIPINIKMMERHPLSSQAFIPMANSRNPYLVVVAPPGEFDMNKLQVFIAQSHQGVNYQAGTWHHFCLALNGDSDFLVVGRIGDGDNEDEVSLAEEQQVTIDISQQLKQLNRDYE